MHVHLGNLWGVLKVTCGRSLSERMGVHEVRAVLTTLCPSGLDTRQAQVIVLSSGTKCISGEHISDQGLVVNDCHAEIVARRAFLHFLYAQLELHLR